MILNAILKLQSSIFLSRRASAGCALLCLWYEGCTFVKVVAGHGTNVAQRHPPPGDSDDVSNSEGPRPTDSVLGESRELCSPLKWPSMVSEGPLSPQFQD